MEHEKAEDIKVKEVETEIKIEICSWKMQIMVHTKGGPHSCVYNAQHVCTHMNLT